MPINTWWSGDRDEVFWLETTGRGDDLGSDLRAPQEDDAGNRQNPGYVLVTYVRDGDIVLHYDLNRGALVGWSLAEGGVWASDAEWASVTGGGEPFVRAHWIHGLKGPFYFGEPIDLADLREVGPAIGAVRAALARAHGGSLYFPFQMYAARWEDLRPGQPYMTKWPAALNAVIPGVSAQIESALLARSLANVAVRPVASASVRVGLDYIKAEEEATIAGADPFSTDPAVIERGIRGHARTQNALARELGLRGLLALRPGPTDPSFDVAWEEGGVLYVAEVKSITDANEQHQLRLGLGQVLWYRHVLSAEGRPVVGLLVPEREPTTGDWESLCASLGVRLTWPGKFTGRDGSW